MNPDGLYDLLPAFLRIADAAEGEPLRALLAVLQDEYQAIETNVAALYDDWFIETCDDWVVPYIADLLGVPGLDSPDLYWGSQRALVGNVLAYRRRKGAADVLAAAAQGATGWPALTVPSNGLLAMTQCLTHLLPAKGRTVDLRDAEALDRLAGPFDTLAHTIDVRPGRFNLLRLGLFLWRLASYPVELAAPCRVRAGCYTFHPFGIDSPLFNPPRTGETAPAAALPVPLDGRLLADEVRALWTGEEPAGPRFLGSGSGQPALRIFARKRGAPALHPIPARSLLFCDLGDWQRPAPRQSYLRADGTPVEQQVAAAVDPARGRLAFAAGIELEAVLVSYAYGFSDGLGGGPYARPAAAASPRGRWLAFVYSGAPASAATQRLPAFPSLTAAVAAMAALPAAPEHIHAVIRLADNGTYDLPPAVSLAPRQSLTLQALDGMRPCVRGTMRVSAGAGPGGATASLTLDGLWIDGRIVLEDGIGKARIVDCTLRPPRPGDGPAASLEAAAMPSLTVELTRCIAGPLWLPGEISGLTVERSILDGGAGVALAGPGGAGSGPPVTFDACTVFGEVRVRQLRHAENTLFTAPVSVSHSTESAVDFCHLPAAAAAAPAFTSTVYGQPGYAQLAAGNSKEIAAGARDGAEIGVFHALRQPQRQANLPGTIAEYLRWGYEATVVFVT
jgi:hypothetical protein